MRGLGLEKLKDVQHRMQRNEKSRGALGGEGCQKGREGLRKIGNL